MALPKILLRGRRIILLVASRMKPRTPATPSAQSLWTTRTSCSKSPSGTLTQLPSATWLANGLRLLKLASGVARHLSQSRAASL